MFKRKTYLNPKLILMQNNLFFISEVQTGEG